MNDVVVIDAVRTPIGSFGGTLKSLAATDLGAITIGDLFKSNSLNPDYIDEVVMGNVLSAGLGQAPARQAALRAGLKNTTPCTLCDSGMSAVMIAMHAIQAGDAGVMIAGGMESMSNVPLYTTGSRFAAKIGHAKLQDGIIKDGLSDSFKHFLMGNAAELCARTHAITRQDQDDYAARSYKQALNARENGLLQNEISRVKIRNSKRQAEIILTDEEIDRFDGEKLTRLPPEFEKEGTITAANASPLSDGAASLLLMSASRAQQLGCKPAARLVSQANAAQATEWFTTSPSKAMARAIDRAKKNVSDIDLFEVDEAFAIVPLITAKLLNIDIEKVNTHGGSLSLGNPIGCTGARLLVTLFHSLRAHDRQWGCAGACLGGGGAAAMVMERIE